jgi:hypothetical protein
MVGSRLAAQTVVKVASMATTNATTPSMLPQTKAAPRLLAAMQAADSPLGRLSSSRLFLRSAARE